MRANRRQKSALNEKITMILMLLCLLLLCLPSKTERDEERILFKKNCDENDDSRERRLKRLKLTRRRSLKTLPLRRRCRQSNRSTTSSRRPVFYDRWLSSKRTSGTPPRRRMRLTWTESWSFLLLLLLCCCCCLLWRTCLGARSEMIISSEEGEEELSFVLSFFSREQSNFITQPKEEEEKREGKKGQKFLSIRFLSFCGSFRHKQL